MPSLPLTLLPLLLAAPTTVPATPPALFPLPTNCSQGATALTVAKNVSVVLDSASSPADLTADSLVSGILSRYQQLLRSKVSWTGAEGAPSAGASGGELGATAAALAVVTAKITGSADGATDLGPETDESYGITVTTSPPTATVTAKTAFGLRHGLETLAQLVVTPSGTIQAPVTISDTPKFPYRGLMIDTGRPPTTTHHHHYHPPRKADPSDHGPYRGLMLRPPFPERGHDQARHRRDGHPETVRLMTSHLCDGHAISPPRALCVQERAALAHP